MNKTIDLVSSNFTVDKTTKYILSIRQFPDGYSFCVIDDINNKCLAIKYTKNIKFQIDINKEPLLQLSYKKILYFGSGAYSIVPKIFIKDNEQSLFLPIEKQLKSRAKTIFNQCLDGSIIISHTNQWMTPKSNIEQHHEIELLIEYALKQTTNNSVNAEITANKINIAVILKNKISLINSYEITNEQDASYYILACYQQLNLSQEETPLNITGDLETNNPTQFLNNYIRYIKIIKPQQWNEEFNINNETFFTLQTQYNLLCE